MDWLGLIPTPDPIPAPWGVFETLDVVTFIIHILIVNVVIGGSIMALYLKFFRKAPEVESSIHGSLNAKIPSLFALGVTFGVAPLLFLQVLYGHLFYSSSVIMATYWILIVPALIFAYYGVYLYKLKNKEKPGLAKMALAVSTGLILYIAFIATNNNTLMLQPQKWGMYFSNRGGTNLNWGEVTLIPRYLHFLTASIAVAGLFSSLVWHFRKKKDPQEAKKWIRFGLRVFAWATVVQLAIGLWWLLSLPGELMSIFLGGNMLYTVVFFLAVLCGIGALVSAFQSKLMPTTGFLLGTVVLMVLSRAFLRAAYLGKFFTVSSLPVNPQYGVMFLFFGVFAVGLMLVWYMLKLAWAAEERRVAQ